MNQKFWENKRVLITGHTGFKGSWLTVWLKKMGVSIVGISKSIPTNPSLFELAAVGEGIKSIFGDIRDYNFLKQIIDETKPEIIFHLAAQSLVKQSYLNPIETYSTNVMGTVNLLEAIKESNTKVVVNVTSDKCYENNDSLKPFTEDDPMGGYDPYSSSKGCSELITQSFRDSFFYNNLERYISISTVRAGNVIGGGDWAEDRLIPDIFRGIKNKELIKIRNPDAIRPWQHVLEPLNGYIILAEKMWYKKQEFDGAWNFGPNEDDRKPVSWIIEKFSELCNSKIYWSIEKEKLHESKILTLNCDKAKSKLDWYPKLKIENAIELTINWYEGYFQNKNMKEITESQINEFEKM